MTTFPTLLLALFAAHALCDYPLQGDFLARGKNFLNPIPGVPWKQCLFAHVLIHAGAVLWITRSWELAVAELVIHWFVDWGKIKGHFGPSTSEYAFNLDQALHYGCKVLWAAVAAASTFS